MGLWKALTNVKRAVCRAAGKAIEKVGVITKNIDIEIAGWNLQCKNPVLKKAVDLNSSDTSVQDTIDVHKLCEESRNQAALQAKKYEDQMVDSLEEDINKFIDALAEIFPQNVLEEFNYGIETSFEDDIHNTVSDYVSIHISQDSEEFVKILNLADSVRAEKTEEYVKKVLDDALYKLQEKCKQKKIAIYRKMCDDLDDFFSNEKKIAEETENNMKELQKYKGNKEYLEKQAIATVTDIAHMECIRTLTYANT